MADIGKVNSVNNVRPKFPSNAITEEKLETIANQMESNFTDLMVKEMRKTIPREEVSGAQSFYEGLMDREYADKLAAHIDLGILDQIKSNMGMSKSRPAQKMIQKPKE
jgi:Rod binding domain-containing protein